ncbi:hypothetical protein MPEAHAMD_0487 [Methylobacterium frigidaeris]|uniref:Uncharacterized protein n=2 Tax=Methylobacterium frigidaeris TaxID=2038277 RepID=A0AA37H7P9_9HYPH|nr:hypothetical protein MPEAHAMD_0487 [Methylobacterium frigidaeris]
MTTIFFGSLRAAPDARQGGVKPVAFVCCSAIVVCHIVDRRRVTKP